MGFEQNLGWKKTNFTYDKDVIDLDGIEKKKRKKDRGYQLSILLERVFFFFFFFIFRKGFKFL